MKYRHTLIFDSHDIPLLSPVHFSWQTHVTRFQADRAASLSLVEKVASHSKVEASVFILSEVSKVVHGQQAWPARVSGLESCARRFSGMIEHNRK